MHLIIEARIAEAADTGDAVDGAVTLAVLERRDRNLSKLGLTLAEGRALLARAQDVLVLISQQIDGWMSGETNCRRCGMALSDKDTRSIVMRTVYGNVAVRSPSCGRVAAVRHQGQRAAP
ncbi:hypothetical protein WKW80_34290 [Variovorax humicola]|uniref:Uncharacterized protein n=1 Tax=Variovorax humicola TaxID=1769758 RepID=A0ABU8WAD8_9BURK